MCQALDCNKRTSILRNSWIWHPPQDIQNKYTLKVIYLRIPISTSSPCLSSVERSLDEADSISTVDTDILSSSESTSSLSGEPWPDVFPVPEFVYDVKVQLQRANDDFKSNGTLFDPILRMKSEILEGLASEIMRYKAYPPLLKLME